MINSLPCPYSPNFACPTWTDHSAFVFCFQSDDSVVECIHSGGIVQAFNSYNPMNVMNNNRLNKHVSLKILILSHLKLNRKWYYKYGVAFSFNLTNETGF